MKNLSWKNLDAFRNLAKTGRNETNMIHSPDVTLVCKDGAREQAHKLMLSAHSEFFYKLFVDSPNCDLVIMTEFNIEDLLEKIYDEKMNPVSAEQFKREQDDKKNKKDKLAYDAKVKSMIQKGKEKMLIGSKEYPTFTCNMCIFPDRLRVEVSRHIQKEHMEAKKWSCFKCDKIYKNRDSFKQHMEKNHKEAKPYHENCFCTEKCQKRYREQNKDTYKSHYKEGYKILKASKRFIKKKTAEKEMGEKIKK